MWVANFTDIFNVPRARASYDFHRCIIRDIKIFFNVYMRAFSDQSACM